MAQPAIYKQRKRRIFGELLKAEEITTDKAWLSIHRSTKELLLTYESRGPVFSLNGGGSLEASHPEVHQAAEVARSVTENGGIVMHGGFSSGVTEAVASAARESGLSVLFPEIESKESHSRPDIIVNSPTPRIDILGTCAPIIVIFRGSLNTFQVLMRVIVHLKNRKYNPDQPVQKVFVSEYWVGLLRTMMQLEILTQEFLVELNFFRSSDQIISKIKTFT